MSEFIQPESSDIIENASLTGNSIRHNNVKSRNTVSRDDQHVLIINIVYITDFALVQKWQAFYVAAMKAVLVVTGNEFVAVYCTSLRGGIQSKMVDLYDVIV